MAASDIPDHTTKPASLAAITLATAELLRQADNKGLPAPDSVSLSWTGRRARLGFAGHRDSVRVLTDWATCFGGEVTAEPYSRGDGEETLSCLVTFPFRGVTVDLHAFIVADQLSST